MRSASGVCLCLLLVSVAVWGSSGLLAGRERRGGSLGGVGMSKQGRKAGARVPLPRDLISKLLGEGEGRGRFTYRLSPRGERRTRSSEGKQRCGLPESAVLEHMPVCEPTNVSSVLSP